MKIFLFLPLLFLCQVTNADQWIQKANFVNNRSGGVSFAIGSKGYVGAGYNEPLGLCKDFWSYDPMNNTWTQLADVPGPERWQAFGFAIDSFGYVGGGIVNGGTGEDFYSYDPSTNSWTQKSDLPTVRYGAVSFSIGRKGYVGTGCTTSSAVNDFWSYDPDLNSWIQKPDFPGPVRWHAAGFSIGGKGYIGTGIDGATLFDDFFEYDTLTDAWNQLADFGGGLLQTGNGFSIGNMGYIMLGASDTAFMNHLWQYNPGNNSWIQKTNFPGSSLGSSMTFSINNKAYICGGDSIVFGTGRYPTPTHWEYFPDSLDGIIELFFLETGFQIFPNPVQDYLTIHTRQPVKLSAYSEEGKLLFKHKQFIDGDRINVRNWAAGIYFLRAEWELKNAVYKVVKE